MLEIALLFDVSASTDAMFKFQQETAAKFPGIKIGKAKMHVPGRCREIKKAHTFETYPTTHFFAAGKLLLTREGVVEPAELAALISDHLLK